jgi:hypothetical protein
MGVLLCASLANSLRARMAVSMACRIFGSQSVWFSFSQCTGKTHHGYQGRVRSRQPAMDDRLFPFAVLTI